MDKRKLQRDRSELKMENAELERFGGHCAKIGATAYRHRYGVINTAIHNPTAAG